MQLRIVIYFFRPSGEEKLRFVLPDESRLYTFAAFGFTPGKGLVVVEKPVQVCHTISAFSNQSSSQLLI